MEDEGRRMIWGRYMFMEELEGHRATVSTKAPYYFQEMLQMWRQHSCLQHCSGFSYRNIKEIAPVVELLGAPYSGGIGFCSQSESQLP